MQEEVPGVGGGAPSPRTGSDAAKGAFSLVETTTFLQFFLFVCFPSLLFIIFCFILDTLYFNFIIYKFSSENNVTTYSTATITWAHR